MPRARRHVPLFAVLALLAVAHSAAAAEQKAFVITTDFATGSLSAIDLDTHAVTLDVGHDVCSDAVARFHDGLLYIVNRGGCDNILVLDPSNGYSVVRQFSTGNGSNPHDICFISPTRAYITRYDDAQLLIVNPSTGSATGAISLASFADADGIPEMDHMIRIGNRVLVSIQLLDRNNNYRPTDRSLVAVIDASTDALVDVDPGTPGIQAITLAGKDPFTPFAFDRDSGRLLLGCVGQFGFQDGGIEWINPVTLASEGFAITEAALAGDLSDFAWNGPSHSYAIVSDSGFNTALVSWNPTTGARTGTLFNPGGFVVADCEVDDRGELYVCDNDFTDPGVRVFSTATDLQIAGPFDTGLPPFQVCFDQQTDEVASVPNARPSLEFSVGPNPARGSARLALRLGGSTIVRLEIFDAAGRRLREWALDAGASGTSEVSWDLRDETGSRVAPGIYLARAKNQEISVVRSLVVMY